MKRRSRRAVGSLVLAATILCAGGPAGSSAAETAAGQTYTGPAIPIGRGSAQVIVQTDPGGTPEAMSVALSPGALEGLPAEPNPESPDGAWAYTIPLPSLPSKLGYELMVVDWNPAGHPPPDIYTVPHFDFHFYMISPEEVARIKFSGPADEAAKVTDQAIIPPGYQVVPETAIDKMGVHALDMSAPEFHGKPFTTTFIYGYYRNRLVFLEPMVTRAFLLSRGSVSRRIPIPHRYSTAGYFPANYSVRYDEDKDRYLIELGNLTPG